jgi:hypothetical protein
VGEGRRKSSRQNAAAEAFNEGTHFGFGFGNGGIRGGNVKRGGGDGGRTFDVVPLEDGFIVRVEVVHVLLFTIQLVRKRAVSSIVVCMRVRERRYKSMEDEGATAERKRLRRVRNR